MSEEESAGVGLIQNLGTSPIDMATGHIDDDLFSVLTPQEFIFSLWLRHKVGPESPEGKPKRPAYQRLYRGWMKTHVSIKGRGRVDAIRGEAVMKGQPANIESEIQKPNWLARNVYDRDYERKEKERLGLE
jgi:hypothetical protein